MKNSWSQKEADKVRVEFSGIGDDFADRIYTTRLLGRDRSLVLHGGGNTSMKSRGTDALGREIDILQVKASGTDMADIGSEGFVALDLAPLRELRDAGALSEDALAAWLSAAALNPSGRSASVEVLLHAFLNYRFIDHTHSNAILALTNQPDAEAIILDLFSDRVAWLPYVMSGTALALAAADAVEASPDLEGLILSNHGIVTFAGSARQAYGRMIALVTMAEQRLAEAGKSVSPTSGKQSEMPGVADIAPIIRGAVARAHEARPFECGPILSFRTTPQILEFVNYGDLHDVSCRGPATPDHVIRTKRLPLVLPVPSPNDLTAYADMVREAVAAYTKEYASYFARHNARHQDSKIMTDPLPRVILVPGVGFFGLGETADAAGIAADLFSTTIEVICAAESIGTYQPAPEDAIFDLEYWAPEQAKLSSARLPRLVNRIVAVTGGGSGIGAATAHAFAAEGAEVVVLDIDEDDARSVAGQINGLAVVCDVTDTTAVRSAFDQLCQTFGGVDIVVSNAGAAWQGEIGTVEDAVLRRSFELNFWAHQTVAQNAVRVMRAQGLGGCLLFNTSKQAVNPGADFGPYGLPKAATLSLVRQYAVDHGKDGIRSNAVNADRIRSGLLTDEMVESRAKARGVSVHDYMAGNLLGVEVTAADVARAFVDLSLSYKTTGAVITVDGGNIAAALR